MNIQRNPQVKQTTFTQITYLPVACSLHIASGIPHYLLYIRFMNRQAPLCILFSALSISATQVQRLGI